MNQGESKELNITIEASTGRVPHPKGFHIDKVLPADQAI